MLWSALNDNYMAVNHSGFAGLQAFAFILLVLSLKHATHTVSSHSKHVLFYSAFCFPEGKKKTPPLLIFCDEPYHI